MEGPCSSEVIKLFQLLPARRELRNFPFVIFKRMIFVTLLGFLVESITLIVWLAQFHNLIFFSIIIRWGDWSPPVMPKLVVGAIHRSSSKCLCVLWHLGFPELLLFRQMLRDIPRRDWVQVNRVFSSFFEKTLGYGFAKTIIPRVLSIFSDPCTPRCQSKDNISFSDCLTVRQSSIVYMSCNIVMKWALPVCPGQLVGLRSLKGWRRSRLSFVPVLNGYRLLDAQGWL